MLVRIHRSETKSQISRMNKPKQKTTTAKNETKRKERKEKTDLIHPLADALPTQSTPAPAPTHDSLQHRPSQGVRIVGEWQHSKNCDRMDIERRR
ncbi:hypothetical protein CPC08DRAFT_259756 [Agrocybe pediades]|nr:hypothetical protein CPC08DRAFT_259756 [Agrocybe pediades]